MMQLFRKTSWREKAQSMVEFALIFPLLIFIIYGIMELGRMLFIYNAVTTASREAARYGSAVGSVDSVPRYLDCAGIVNAARRAAILTPIDAGNMTIVYDRGSVGTEFATSCEAANNPDLKFNLGDRIRVMVATNYTPIFPIVNFPGFPISSTTARTILRTVEIIGTPAPLLSSNPFVIFEKSTQSGTETELDTDANAIWVKLSAPSVNNVTVFFSYDDATCHGTATKGEDYNGLSSVIIPAGIERMKIAQVINDPYDEENETIEVCIVSTSGGQIDESNRKHVTTIIDTETDDPPPPVYFKVTQQMVKEKASTLIEAVLGLKSGKPVSVSFNETGTATNPADYTLPGGTIFSFLPGSTSDQVLFEAVWDKLYEGADNEYVLLTLINPVNAIIDPGNPNSKETVVIQDLDEPPQVSFDLAAQTGLEDANVPLTLLAILDKPSAVDVTVAFDVADETATKGKDYDVPTKSPLTIPAGSTEAAITINILVDQEVEPDETFVITMGAVTNATKVAPTTHTVTITEAFGPPKVRLEADRGVDEGTGQTTVRVLMDHAWNQVVTVPFVYSDGTAKSPDDYVVLTTAAVTIPIGRVYGSILLTVVDDTIDEDNETVHFGISAPISGGATLDPAGPTTHTLTIIDNDIGPEVFFAIAASQGMEDGGPITVQVMLNTLSSRDITAYYYVTGSATPNVDYTIQASPVVIKAGSISANIVVTPVDDVIPTEPNETVIITIGSVTNGSVGTESVHTVTIKDDDICPSLYSRNIQPNAGMTYMTLGLMYSDLTQPPVYITRVSIEWNNGQGQRLTQVDWNTNPIWSDKNGTNTAPLNLTFTGQQSDLLYAPSTTETMLVVFFKNEIRGVPNDYSMTITFSNGCIVP